ncbi:hypothetical protein FKM82_009711 [Ascaphus truei]
MLTYVFNKMKIVQRIPVDKENLICKEMKVKYAFKDDTFCLCNQIKLCLQTFSEVSVQIPLNAVNNQTIVFSFSFKGKKYVCFC